MAAAVSARRNGADVIIAEHDPLPGGVLNRCIHHGFGLGYFGEDLTGTEYAARFRSQLMVPGIRVFTSAAVLSLSEDASALLSSAAGLVRVRFRSCILASGSMEMTLSGVPVAGTRPEGIYTAGCLQGLLNTGGWEIKGRTIEERAVRSPDTDGWIGHSQDTDGWIGHSPDTGRRIRRSLDLGEHIVILGSGNVGQIMGRQLIMAGKHIDAMIEQNEHPGGLARNRRECIEAFKIPLKLCATITCIHGYRHIQAVTVKDLKTGRTEKIKCDTLITALGLIPDRTLIQPLIKNGSAPSWLHLAGNCDTIHDIVDSATIQGERIGQLAASASHRQAAPL